MAAFVLIAGISALFAWAGVMAVDTQSRRILAVPGVYLDVTAADLAAAVEKSALPALPEPENIPSLLPGENPTAALPPKTASEPPPPQPGLAPWKANAARIGPVDGRPRIAVIVTGLGWRLADTELALQKLPVRATLAFTPYAPDVVEFAAMARRGDREVLLELPLEPLFYPNNDPGPLGLLTANDTAQNEKNLQTIIARAEKAVGFLSVMGGKFLTQDLPMRGLLQQLQKSGYLWVDAGEVPGSKSLVLGQELKLPLAQATLVLDTDPGRAAIAANLRKLEAQAQASGFAIGILRATPASIEIIAAWAPELDKKGFALVPITRMVDAQWQ